MDYEISGNTMQTLIIRLEPDEAVFSETGSLLLMSGGVEMTTSSGGLMGALARRFTGNSLFLNFFEAKHEPGEVMFTTRMPGHIVPLDMKWHGDVIVQRHAFLCAETSVQYTTGMTLKLGRFLGGNGLLFNRIRGEGTAFVSIDGEVVQQTLRAGEKVLVHPGHLACFTATVKYRTQVVRGVRNILFGGEGLYLVELSGPGTIWLHSLSIHNLHEILLQTASD
ncbi:MAG: TIGR00266 family protein [Alicyclobacillus sp.]|nr:TIGR00266 family protein [Alicyclobacillus sp.]